MDGKKVCHLLAANIALVAAKYRDLSDDYAPRW